ncbi:MAG TPA: phosphate acyltransferase PlsX [Candidatus Binataceae bacterium]|nr:phosphate acyltransferase PlsX [Candidatus Binataceae bacterium]
MRIALDAMGGDLAPKAALEGAVEAARDFQIEVVLVGDREVIVRELGDYDLRGLPITIEHASEIVAMDDPPLESVLTKPESSIHVGLELVKRGKVDGFVSAGNSGAVMATAMAILGNLPGVDRPAIASIIPTTAGLSLLIDAGANTDVKPLNLVQFAVMGAVYWRQVQKVAHPRVGILSNGEEASKGTELTRSAAAALLQMALHVNYIGYVEGRDINRAKADVVVTDGFTGNVTLKTMEGFASFLLGNLREVFGTGLLRRLLYFLVFRRRVNSIRQRLDPAEYGGAPLLGVNGVAIVAHGSSSARAIRNAVRAAANEALVRHVNSEIVDVLAASPLNLIAKPVSGRGIRGMLERMRERLHAGRDSHGPRRPEAHPELVTARDAIHARHEPTPSVLTTPRIEPVSHEGHPPESANGRKGSVEHGAPANGLPSNGESTHAATEERVDNGSPQSKPV